MGMKDYFKKMKKRSQDRIKTQESCKHDWKETNVDLKINGFLFGIFGDGGHIKVKGYICSKCEKELFPDIDSSY